MESQLLVDLSVCQGASFLSTDPLDGAEYKTLQLLELLSGKFFLKII
jgi:hypothetical protein